MIDPREFAKKQFELAAEFGKYLFARPEVDERLVDERGPENGCPHYPHMFY